VVEGIQEAANSSDKRRNNKIRNLLDVPELEDLTSENTNLEVTLGTYGDIFIRYRSKSSPKKPDVRTVKIEVPEKIQGL
jgi:hypothetical protein